LPSISFSISTIERAFVESMVFEDSGLAKLAIALQGFELDDRVAKRRILDPSWRGQSDPRRVQAA
jgi:hypothetical protein